MQVQHVGAIALCLQGSILVGATNNVYPAACPDGICPMLGQTFYLPKPDAVQLGGHAFAQNTKIGNCATVRAAERTTRAVKETDSMQKLVQDTNTEWSLSGSFTTAALTVKGSVGVRTSQDSELTSSFHSTHLDITYLTQEVSLDWSELCFSKESDIDSVFLSYFQALPDIDPEKVHESSSWAPYVNFLENQGSHIMVEQSIGSRFQQWESSTSSSSDITKALQVKACADVEGVVGLGGWSVSSCAAYNNTEKKESLKTASYTHRIILGGTEDTRIALNTRMGNDTLAAFIASAPSGTEPVSYGFDPVWVALINFYTIKCSENGAASADCRHLQHAYNLQAAYEGWLAFGCSRHETSNGIIYQTMAITDPSATMKTYQCNAARTGCYSNDDCHIGGAGSVCYCYGPSCIDSGDVVPGTSIKRDKVRGDESDHYYSGVNKACHYHVGVYCVCDSTWAGGLSNRSLWVQDGSYAKSTASISV